MAAPPIPNIGAPIAVTFIDPVSGLPINPFSSEVTLEQFGYTSGFADSALASAVAAITATGGGRILFRGKTYAFQNPFPTPANDGSSPPNSVPIMLEGTGAWYDGRWGSTQYGGTILDFQVAAASSGKIFLSGRGYFGARGITFTDSTNKAGFLIYTTNTVLDIQSCTFKGIHGYTVDSTAASQDAICMGGTTTTITGTSPTAAFQGYGSQIVNCFFHGIRRALYGRMYCNATKFKDNIISYTCGPNNAGSDTTACVEYDGTSVAGNVCAGNLVVGNLFEMGHYDSAIKLTGGLKNIIGWNGYYDGTPANNTACVILNGTGTQLNLIDEGANVTAMPLIQDNTSLTWTFSGNGVTTTFSLATPVPNADTSSGRFYVTIAGVYVLPSAYTISGVAGNIVFSSPPASGTNNIVVIEKSQVNYSRSSTQNLYSISGPLSVPNVDYPAAFGWMQIGNPLGTGPFLTLCPDYPASAGLVQNAAGAGAVGPGAAVFRLKQSAADGGADIWTVTYNGAQLWGSAGSIQVNGTRWINQGSGGDMYWNSGTGGSYGHLVHYGLKFDKFDGSGTSGQLVWSVNGYLQLSGMQLYLPTPALAAQSTAALYAGSGAPSNSNGNDGDYYLRGDTPGVALQRIYVKSAGSWSGIL